MNRHTPGPWKVLEAKANARLIAAAPEMYAIIDYFVQLVEDGIETDVIKFTEDGCFSQAKALLAKIDGGE